MGDKVADRELVHEHKKRWLAAVNTYGDERACLLALCEVLARLDVIEAKIAGLRSDAGSVEPSDVTP